METQQNLDYGIINDIQYLPKKIKDLTNKNTIQTVLELCFGKPPVLSLPF